MSRALGFLLLIAGVAALVGAWTWLRSDRDGGDADAGRPPYVLPVTLAEVARGDVQPSVQLTGTVRSSRYARFAFETAGRLVELAVQDADAVTAGQLLARLGDADQRLELASAAAAVEVAARELERLEAGERAEEIERLRAELEAATAEEDLAQLEVERRRELASLSDVSRAEMDRVTATARAAAARRRATEEQLAQAEAGTREEDLAVSRARLSMTRAAHERAQRELAKTELRAPWDGAVVRRHASVGDHLTPGDTLIELADVAHLEIDVEVPSAYGLRLGDLPEVIVRIDEAPGFALRTRLDATVPTADAASRNFRALVRLDATEAQGLLRPGMFVRLELLLDPLQGELVVPADAVRTTEQGAIVVAADEGEAGLVGRFVPVRLLGSADGRSAIAPLADDPDAALAAGDRVVVTGVDLAYTGVALLQRTRGAGGGEAANAPSGTNGQPAADAGGESADGAPAAHAATNDADANADERRTDDAAHGTAGDPGGAAADGQR